MSTVTESYLVGLIGAGITASLTPPMHETEAAHHGLHYLYRPVDLEVIGRPGSDVGELLRAGRELGFNAFNITHPCKQLVLSHLDEVTPAAAALGAVNTVLVRDGRFVGHNTDQSGFAAGLTTELPGAARDTVVQIGTGGAGSAVAAALLSAGVRTLHLFDVDGARAAERAAALAAVFPGREVVAAPAGALPELVPAADGVVNATPVGMHRHPGTPVDPALLDGRQWVADVVYLPVDTELVVAARAKGCRVLDGGHMAVGQAVDAFRLITGVTPDRARMREHFLDLLATRQTASQTAPPGP
ncbi:shikimate dehydrogenase [Kocuria sp. SM24M-10]|uniref:shikimate dehydrogenase n=1 Tax=Kocuria sp. SM24M-10 TaxID=1660349 RepID=UPI00064A40C8|nr:shikimate dehydrogenase [Kocuria sp. SM24M-10]KLU10291.1 shikimate dehydrogenase [Kocuria sp. SM24M-10]